MNKKGFTLIEILVTIVLIAAISVTVGVSMTGMLERQEEKDLNNYIKSIEDAACVFAEVNDITTDTTIKINDLLSKGLLKKDLINPKTKAKITEYGNDDIKITWENYEKKCKYEYNAS